MRLCDMRFRARIERPVGGCDADGFPVKGFLEVATVFAGLSSVGGREYLEAAARQMEDVVTVTIRWRDDLNTDMRVAVDGDFYEIVHIDRMDRRRDYIKLKCRKNGGEGA